MPIIRIRALQQNKNIDVEAILKKLCCGVADAVDFPKHQIWASWEELLPGHYVEGDNGADKQPPQTHPPLVEILAFAGRSQEFIETILKTTADILAQELELHSNVFVTYVEAQSGRVFDGEKIVYKK